MSDPPLARSNPVPRRVPPPLGDLTFKDRKRDRQIAVRAGRLKGYGSGRVRKGSAHVAFAIVEARIGHGDRDHRCGCPKFCAVHEVPCDEDICHALVENAVPHAAQVVVDEGGDKGLNNRSHGAI
jgi:hypothetical protein